MLRNTRIFANRIVSVIVMVCIAVVLQVHASSQIFPEQSDQVDLSAYVLPDGTLPVLCLFHDGGEGDGQTLRCPACALAKSIDCGSSYQFSVHARFLVAKHPVLRDGQIAAQLSWPLFRPRGPPLA